MAKVNQSYFLNGSSGNVRFGSIAPILLPTDNENDTYIWSTNGLPTGQALRTYNFDKTSNTWVLTSQRSNVSFGSSIPTALLTDNENDTYIRTSDGTPTGTILGTYVFDQTSSGWYLQASTIVLDGNNVSVNRSTSTIGAMPTNIEVPNPINNDTATVNLLNGLIEQWSFIGGAWTLMNTTSILKKLRFVQPLVAGNNLITLGTTLSSSPMVVEVRNNATGAVITHRIPAETTTSVTINVRGSIASARITIIG